MWPRYARRVVAYLEIDLAKRTQDDAAVLEICARSWHLCRHEEMLIPYTFTMVGALRRMGRPLDALDAVLKSLRRGLRIGIPGERIAELTELCETVCQEGGLPLPTAIEYRRGVKVAISLGTDRQRRERGSCPVRSPAHRRP